jgi:hypothetical protein
MSLPESVKLCECGCGIATKQTRQKETRDGYVSGQYRRFVRGHGTKGSNNHWWNGGKSVNGQGYIMIKLPAHPRADKKGYVYEHIIIAERAAGFILPKQAVVHHHNRIRSDNVNQNLVICENKKYHEHIHKRTRAFHACGDASKVPCVYCKGYDVMGNMSPTSNDVRAWHRKCHAEYEYARRRRVIA